MSFDTVESNSPTSRRQEAHNNNAPPLAPYFLHSGCKCAAKASMILRLGVRDEQEI